jgi:hypothetical protein
MPQPPRRRRVTTTRTIDETREDLLVMLGSASAAMRAFVEEYFTAENIDCLESDPIAARAYRVTRFFNAEVGQIRQNAEWGGWRFAGRE